MNRQILFAALLASFLMACNSQEQASEDAEVDLQESGPLKVAVSSYPLMYFTDRIGGDEVEVLFLAPEDEDPAFWSPVPEDVRAMQDSDLIILNGATYEKWEAIVTLPESKVLRTADPIKGELLKLQAVTTHAHGPTGEHSHEGTDFNTWLDPTLAIKQTRVIRDALTAMKPDSTETFEQRFDSLQSDLNALHEKLQEATAEFGYQPVVASHPVYGYFAQQYGINLKSMLWEPETMPSDEQWEEFSRLLADHPAKVMIWEGEPDPAIESRLNEYGVTGCVVSPAGNVPEQGDYLDVWNANADRLAEAEP